MTTFPFAITEPGTPAAEVPSQLPKLWGIEYGLGRFAAALICWDPDKDVIHVRYSYRIIGQPPSNNVCIMKYSALAVPVCWRERGQPQSEQYRALGLKMLPEPSTYSAEAAIREVQQRMVTARFKVVSHLSDWLKEFELYGGGDSERDDLLSATFLAITNKDLARAVPLGPWVHEPPVEH